MRNLLVTSGSCSCSRNCFRQPQMTLTSSTLSKFGVPRAVSRRSLSSLMARSLLRERGERGRGFLKVKYKVEVALCVCVCLTLVSCRGQLDSYRVIRSPWRSEWWEREHEGWSEDRKLTNQNPTKKRGRGEKKERAKNEVMKTWERVRVTDKDFNKLTNFLFFLRSMYSRYTRQWELLFTFWMTQSTTI